MAKSAQYTVNIATIGPGKLPAAYYITNHPTIPVIIVL